MTGISVCGLLCRECDFFSETCSGCTAVAGKPFWTDEIPGNICPIYNCATNNRDYTSCGDCSELPCALFRELKDPGSSDEEHAKNIVERVNRLRNAR